MGVYVTKFIPKSCKTWIREGSQSQSSSPEASVELSLQAELYWELGIVSDWNYHGHAISRPETWPKTRKREKNPSMMVMNKGAITEY